MPAPGEQYETASEEIPNALSKYTNEEVAELRETLSRNLGPEYVSIRPGPGNTKLMYVAGEKVINLANDVFGFNGWSSSIRSIVLDAVEDTSDGRGLKFAVGVSVIMRVTLKDGTYHEDLGYGSCEGMKSKLAGLEKAKKEAATDALKRALRLFGNVLGLCMRDKGYTSNVSKIKPQPTKFNIDQLHRHQDFMPVKKENELSPTKPAVAPIGPVFPTGAELEDEFGDEFDEADFIEGHEMDQVFSGKNITKNVQPSNTNQQDVTYIRRQTIPPQRPLPQVHQGPSKTLQTPQTPGRLGNGAPAPAVQQSHHFQRPHQSPAGPAQIVQTRTSHSNNLPSVKTGAADRPLGQRPPEEDGLFLTSDSGSGFVTARGVVNTKGDDAAPLPQAPAFNPHADSPSIRKTNGVDHTKSRPVPREAASSGLNPVGNGASDSPVPQRMNGVNPQLEGIRQIGRPPAAGAGGIASPLQNRGHFKMPSPAVNAAAGYKRPADGLATGGQTRTPLADISTAQNQNTVSGVADAKKLKTENS